MTEDERDVLKMAVSTIAVLRLAVAHLAVRSPACDTLITALEEYKPDARVPSSACTEAAIDELLLLIRRGLPGPAGEAGR